MIDPEPRLRSQVIAEIRIGNPPYPWTLDPSQPGNGVVDVEVEHALSRGQGLLLHTYVHLCPGIPK